MASERKRDGRVAGPERGSSRIIGGLTPASFRWELAMQEGVFERSIAEGGLGTAISLLEQMEVWVAEERSVQAKS
jgi:hypothetical protein